MVMAKIQSIIKDWRFSFSWSIVLTIGLFINSHINVYADDLPGGYFQPVWILSGVFIALYWQYGSRILPALYISSVVCAAVILQDLLDIQTHWALLWLGHLFMGLPGLLIPPMQHGVGFKLGLKKAAVFETVRDSFLFILSIILACIICWPVTGVAFLFYQNALTDFDPWQWVLLCLSHGLYLNIPILVGAYLFAPLLVVMLQYKSMPALSSRRKQELVIVLAMTVVLGALFFTGLFDGYTYTRHPVFLIPLIVWTAFRFDVLYSLIQVLLLGIMAYWGMVNTVGPFEIGSTLTNILYSEAFICLCMLITITITSAVKEQRQLDLTLEHARTNLEDRVAQRTIELRQASQNLQIMLDQQKTQLTEARLISEIAEVVNSVSHPSTIRDLVKILQKYLSYPVGLLIRFDEDHLLIQYQASTDEGDTNIQRRYAEALKEAVQGLVLDKSQLVYEFCTTQRDQPLHLLLLPVFVNGRLSAMLGFCVDHYVSIQQSTLNTLYEINNLVKQFYERVDAQEKNEALNEKLIDASRKAGMSEVASGILHNAGNALNSVNTALHLTNLKVRQLPFEKIEKTLYLIEDNKTDLELFLTQRNRQVTIANYLVEIGVQLKETTSQIQDELNTTDKALEHISQLINKQAVLTQGVNFSQVVRVNDLVKQAISFMQDELRQFGTKVRLELGDLPEVKSDKHGLLQVLNNLLSNANSAMQSIDVEQRIISITTCQQDDQIRLTIKDNGSGIDKELQPMIFKHGFTTKKTGHGFGLHSCMNIMQRLQGNLSFCSEGRDRGAMFIITLPAVYQRTLVDTVDVCSVAL